MTLPLFPFYFLDSFKALQYDANISATSRRLEDQYGTVLRDFETHLMGNEESVLSLQLKRELQYSEETLAFGVGCSQPSIVQ